jgi:8-oxo-dGTP pyrophosphatase MutT (NUDIX family)
MLTEDQADTEYLIVEAKEVPDDWVLPKGHIEPEEDMAETAVREIVEETGVWARIDSELGTIFFDLKGERAEVRFYLMEAMACETPQEQRKIQWLPRDAAINTVPKESKDLLRRADHILRVAQRD